MCFVACYRNITHRRPFSRQGYATLDRELRLSRRKFMASAAAAGSVR